MRILYVTRSGAAELDDDAAEFALDLARMGQHAGHRVEVLVEVPTSDAAARPSTTVKGVTVRRIAWGTGRGRMPLPQALAGTGFDLVHLLDLRAGIACEVPGPHPTSLVVNVDTGPEPGATPGPGVAETVQAAACCIAPDEDAASRVRAHWPGRSCHVVLPGVDLLAIASGRSLTPRTGPLRAGWTGTPCPTFTQILATVGLHGQPIDGRPAQRRASLHHIDLLCLPADAPRRHVYEAQAAGLPVLIGAGASAAGTMGRSGAGAVIAPEDDSEWARVLGTWANDADLRATWRQAVRPPPRIEETAFLYESLYRRTMPGL